MKQALYIYLLQEATELPREEGEAWPMGRRYHAACCIGYNTESRHLLICGGVGNDKKALSDIWLLNVETKKWRQVASYITVLIQKLESA